MKVEKATRRDKKRKNKNKMVVTGKSLFLLQEIQIKRANKVKNSLTPK